MKVGDIVVDKMSLATIVGKTTDGKWIIEWASTSPTEELGVVAEEELFLVEEVDGISSED